jgi:HEPN domain-containing protein
MKSKRTDPEEWIRRANVNLEKIKEIKSNKKIDREEDCFEAQQASEKAIKGVMVFLKIEYPHSHSIRTLLDIIQKNGYNVPEKIWEAEKLTSFSGEPRYPGDYDPVTKEEMRALIKIGRNVVKWAEKIIQDKNTLFK